MKNMAAEIKGSTLPIPKITMGHRLFSY